MAECSDPEFVLSESQGKYFSLETNEHMQALIDLTITSTKPFLLHSRSILSDIN